VARIDQKLISWFRRAALPMARAAVFIVYFYFGLLKLLGESPASPLARALTDKTIGMSHFDAAFNVLAVFECVIGILFLFPRLTRLVIPLLIIHVLIVCSPLVLVPHLAWVKPFVPTLEGQYIIKNVLLVAVAIGVAAQTQPFRVASKR
jgi:uncharacterized membrane protein YkgB